MKKVLKSFILILLCVCTCLTFTGCGKTKWSETTVNTQGVLSNGGIVLTSTQDGWLYFVNGTKKNTSANVEKSNVQSAIYRVKTDDKGNILYKESTTQASEDKDEVKEFQQIERVVDNVVGYKDGSIYAFGDYIYYATPSKSVNDDGEMLNNKTEFRRYDLKNQRSQAIYTNASSSDTLTYGYYVQNNSLFLLVFEKNKETLTSLQIGDEIKTVFVKNDVKSVLLSEAVNGDDFAEKYVYYTLSYEPNAVVQRGVRVFRVLPNGTDEAKISQDKDIALLSVRGTSIIYSYNKYVYHRVLDATVTSLPTEESNVVCHEEYENIVFEETSAGHNATGILFYDNTSIRYMKWENGVCTVNEIIHGFGPSQEVTFIGVDGDWVIYEHKDVICKSQFKNITDPDLKKPIELSKTNIDEAKDLMAPEIMNGYLYGFYTDSKSETTYLYRISLEAPEVEGELENAEFIGVKE